MRGANRPKGYLATPSGYAHTLLLTTGLMVLGMFYSLTAKELLPSAVFGALSLVTAVSMAVHLKSFIDSGGYNGSWGSHRYVNFAQLVIVANIVVLISGGVWSGDATWWVWDVPAIEIIGLMVTIILMVFFGKVPGDK